jgi:ActD protein
MTGPLLAEFKDPAGLRSALSAVREAGHRLLDAFTPFPVEGLDEDLGIRPPRIRWAMLAAGLLVAAFAYGIQWWSAVYDYPINVGGRPLHSWPVFLLAPFEVSVLAAALAGFIAFLRACGLPRLHDPLFEVPGFERASQDRFFLLAQDTFDENGLSLRHLLEHAGAVVVTEVRGS